MANYLPILLYILMPIFGVYMLLCIVRMFRAPSPAKALAISQENLTVAQENTMALRENSALLRELIATNRQLLEKQIKGES